MINTDLVRRGFCSVKKELPRSPKTTLAQRQSNRRHSLAVGMVKKPKRAPKLKARSISPIRYGPSRAQATGQISFSPHSILNFKPTPIKRGEKITLRPKVHFIPPSHVSTAPHRAAERASRPKLNREQRITAAKLEARKPVDALYERMTEGAK